MTCLLSTRIKWFHKEGVALFVIMDLVVIGYHLVRYGAICLHYVLRYFGPSQHTIK